MGRWQGLGASVPTYGVVSPRGPVAVFAGAPDENAVEEGGAAFGDLFEVWVFDCVIVVGVDADFVGFPPKGPRYCGGQRRGRGRGRFSTRW